MPAGRFSPPSVLLASLLCGACGRTALLTEPAVRDCTGIDLQTDVKNCGACGNRCSATTAAAATCNGGRCLVTLATNLDSVMAIALDAESVYWTSTTSVVKVAKTGGQPVTVVAGQSGGPSSLTLDGTNLYWINRFSGAIMQAPKSGSPVLQLAADQPSADNGIAVDATSVYWTTNPTVDYPSGSVMKVAIGGGTPVALASAQYDPTGIGVDAMSAYWTTEYYLLMKMPVAGGTPVSIGSAGLGPVLLRNGFAYSFLGENVVKVPVAGGDTTILAQSPGNFLPEGIAVDDTSVYWTEAEWLLKVASDGGPLERLLWRQSPGAIAVDDTSVYWANGASAVMKLTPK